MTAIHVAARRHPQLVDAVLAGLLAAVSAQAAAELGQVSGVGWVWFVAFHVPLVWRRRAPVVVFWVIVVVGLVWVGDGGHVSGFSLLVVPMIALYTVARYRPRRHLWPPAALVVPLTVGWVGNGGPWWDVVALAGLFGASALLGVNTRQIVAAGSAARILVLTTFDLDEYVFAALRAGASGFPQGRDARGAARRHPDRCRGRRGRRAGHHPPADRGLRPPSADVDRAIARGRTAGPAHRA